MPLTAINTDSVIFYSYDFLRQDQCSLEVIQLGQITQLDASVGLV